MSAKGTGFTVKISVDIITADGQKFFNNATQYDNLPYDKMHALEGKLVALMQELHALGAPAA